MKEILLEATEQGFDTIILADGITLYAHKGEIQNRQMNEMVLMVHNPTIRHIETLDCCKVRISYTSVEFMEIRSPYQLIRIGNEHH